MAPLSARPRQGSAAARRTAASRSAGRRRAAAAGAALLGLAGCGSLPPPPLLPEPVAWADTIPIPEPDPRHFSEPAELLEAGVIHPAAAALDVGRWAGRERVALNITRMDDVVPSTWFEHRNAAGALPLEAVRRGGASNPGPDTSRPLEVVRAKSSGIQPGFWVRDARGEVYLLKLDPPAWPGLSSTAEVVTSRLLHAAGYHVPANYRLAFRPEGLVPGPEARVRDGSGERPMTADDLARELSRGARLPDGRVPAVASHFLPGVPKGPWRFEGRRADDPNDHYRHEHRRELRGLHVVAAWLNHVDLRFQNTLDVWIEPPGYLRHYLLDFGSSLGSGGVRPHRPREGLEHNLDLWAGGLRLVSLGFYRAGWEGPWEEPLHPAIGRLPAQDFRPGAWKPNWPNGAWRQLNPADGYWGAKLVASFTDAQLEAAVSAAELPAAAATELTRILAERRDRTVGYWFARVTPLERPAVTPTTDGSPAFELSFDDLGLALPSVGPTRYDWELRHGALRLRWRGSSAADGGGRQRVRVGPGSHRDVDAEGTGGSENGAGGARGSAALDPSRRDAYAVLRVWAVRADGSDGEPGGVRTGRPATLWLLWRGAERGYEVAALRH